MKDNIIKIISFCVLLYYFIVRIFLNIFYKPTYIQNSALILSIIFLISNFQKNDLLDFSKNQLSIKKVVLYCSLIVQVLINIYGFNLNNTILDWVSVSSFVIFFIVYMDIF